MCIRDSIIIDGGNSHFNDTEKRILSLKENEIQFIGMGISGGQKGALEGPSLMIGGDRKAYETVKKDLNNIAAKDSKGNPCCGFLGSGGAGHYIKMVHNGIEYAEMQKELGLSEMPSWLAPTIGFFLGALFLFGLDKIIPHLHLFEKKIDAEGVNTKWQKTILLVLAIALHNIPEGLAVGVAFGAIASPELLDVEIFTLGSAIALAIGIGIQNFPEGFAVSLPLRRQGMSKFKSWQWGQLSAIVEPIFAVIGAAIVLQVLPILPYALAFATGAMIFIVVEEVIPESQKGGNTDLATMGLIAGFIVMMMLDVGLG